MSNTTASEIIFLNKTDTSASKNLSTCLLSKNKLHVICNYQLLTLIDEKSIKLNLAVNDIPFNDCDEVIVEEAIVKSTGEIVYSNSKNRNENLLTKFLLLVKKMVFFRNLLQISSFFLGTK